MIDVEQEQDQEIEVKVNEVYQPFIDGEISGYRYYILYGGRGGGKTVSIPQRLVRQCVENDYFKCIVAREYYTNVRDSSFEEILKVIRAMGIEEYFHLTLNPLKLTCTLNGNQFLARGLDNVDKIKGVSNPTAFWLDEADCLKEKDFNDLDFTFRSEFDVPIEIYLSFNPYDENFWLIRKFFPMKQEFEKPDGNFHEVQSKRDDCYILHTTYKDNAFIDDSFLNSMEQFEIDNPDDYKVDGLGLFGEGKKGIIYKNWKPIDSLPEGGEKIIGIDYGNVNPSAVIEVVYKDGEIFLNELLYAPGYTQNTLANELYDMNVSNTIPMYPDSAEPSLVDELEELGFLAYPSKKGSGSVYQGIQFILNFEPFYVTKSSVNLIKELRNYSWKEDRHGNIADSQPKKLYDHGCDAFRYAIHTHGKENWKNKAELITFGKKDKRKPKNLRFTSHSSRNSDRFKT